MARGPAEAELQAELIAIALPAIQHLGFVIAGGHVVRLHGIRPGRLSDDLDLFTNIVGSNVVRARDIVINAVEAAGHGVEIDPISNQEFVRLNIATRGGVTTKIELGVDWRKEPPTVLAVGPVLSVGDSFASKVLALWGRSAPRDVIDVYAYLRSGAFTQDDGLELAAEYDAGFTASDFARVLRRLDNITDAQFVSFGAGADEIPPMRDYFADWAADIARSGRP